MRRVHDESDTKDKARAAHTPRALANEPGERPATSGPLEAMVESLQRSAGNAAVSSLLARDGAPDAIPPDVSAGEALPPALQAAGERKLRADLSAVRVHTSSAAATLAEGLGAEAVTLGQDVFMSPRVGGLETSRGRKTLVHELVHTVQSTGHASAGAVSGVSSPSSAAEREASQIGADGFDGARAQPALVAPAGIAHRKVAEEEEEEEEEAAAEKKKAAMPDFLNPEPLTEAEQRAGGAPQASKPGESGAAESIAYEITVMQPLRAALSAIEQQDWAAALEVLDSIGMKLLDYQLAYESRDPHMYTRFMSARGWLALVYHQLKLRMGQSSWSDDVMTEHMRDYVNEFKLIQEKL